MLHVALLAIVIAATDSQSANTTSPIQRCLATMDGAVYTGDPSDLTTMRAGVGACERARTAAQHIAVSAAQGPERLYVIARLLDRAATLSYMGLGDARSALRDVREANLYFRIAAGLPKRSADFHAAALANVELTTLQLQTLRSDIASRATPGIRARQLHRER